MRARNCCRRSTAVTDLDRLRRAVEAVLLVAEEPVDVATLADVLDAPADTVTALLRALRREYADADRGFVLREAAGGWRLYTDPAVAPAVESYLVGGRTTRLSQAALETLAVVAYEQPVTRARVSEIRGVDADGAVRTLVGHGLVEEVGRADTLGQPLLYGTTTAFLERVGLQSLDDLPPISRFEVPGPPPAEPAPGDYRQARKDMAEGSGTGE